MADDHETLVKALVAPGWPAVEPKIDEIIGWLEDGNCPGAWVAFDFLKSVGTPLIPHLKKALLAANEEILSLLLSLLEASPVEVVAPLVSELETLTCRRDHSDTDLRAVGLLARHRLKEADWLRREIQNRIQGAEGALGEYRQMLRALE